MEIVSSLQQFNMDYIFYFKKWKQQLLGWFTFMLIMLLLILKKDYYSNKIAIKYLLSPFFFAIYSSYENGFSFFFFF